MKRVDWGSFERILGG